MKGWSQYPLRIALKDHFVLEISITEICNLSCKFCCHATSENTSKHHMPLDDILVLSNSITPHEFFAVKISGGEPTNHPDFEKIVSNLKVWFKAHHYCLVTNGNSLLRYKNLLCAFDSIEISHYPGINDSVVEKIKKTSLDVPLVFIDRINGISMHNVFEQPNQSKRYIFSRCRYPAWKKVIQGRIYPCSNIFGQAIRQGFDPHSVSVPVNKNWRNVIKSIDIEDHCRRCWVNVGDPEGAACRIL